MQDSAKLPFLGLDNFVTAVAHHLFVYHFCLNLLACAAFLQPRNGNLSEPCTSATSVTVTTTNLIVKKCKLGKICRS